MPHSTPPILEQPKFLPTTRQEMAALGWQELDVLLVTGDAYIDHPIHGAALLGRWLVAHGFRTGIVAQPRWQTPEDFLAMGRPRLFAGITSGSMDSMLAHYTSFRKIRHDDGYTPGAKAGRRPNRATLVYANLARQAFPGLPIVLGGIEASLRRAVHYDFWTEKLRQPLLVDAKATLLVYGMGEHAILAIARFLDGGGSLEAPSGGRTGLPGVVFCGKREELPEGATVRELPGLEAIEADKKLLVRTTLELEAQMHDGVSWATQPVGTRLVIMTPPAPRLTDAEMDALYGLPFSRDAHPSYTEPIPALEMIRFSITSHRGCAGGCSFCSLALHQGRLCSSRSEASILDEVGRMSRRRDWTGTVSDVGGPTVNMWGARCRMSKGHCRRSSCLFPKICPNFEFKPQRHLQMLRHVKAAPGVKNVRIASGFRFDLGLQDAESLGAYIREFIGGQLKIAPEHLDDRILKLMRKPPNEVFDRFLEVFAQECRRAGKEQYVIPYLITAFPGCTEDDMRRLAGWLRERHWLPQQIQCFVPTPGTLATAMYYAGTDAEGNPIPVDRSDAGRLRQHHMLSAADTGSRSGPERRPRRN